MDDKGEAVEVPPNPPNVFVVDWPKGELVTVVAANTGVLDVDEPNKDFAVVVATAAPNIDDCVVTVVAAAPKSEP